MKQNLVKILAIPEGVSCSFSDGHLECSKGSISLRRKLNARKAEISLENNEIKIVVKKGNRKDYSEIMTFVAHVKNIFKQLDEKAVYELEVCSVHFPMTVKVEGNEFQINNFIGEKEKRTAVILPEVNVKVEGNKVIVSSHNIEKAGQTAANIEKATKVGKKDKRVFQDGIFLVSKNGEEI